MRPNDEDSKVIKKMMLNNFQISLDTNYPIG